MSSYFGLSIRFLDSVFHGRRDGGEPEWPPSTLRAFQSLVAASARMAGGSLAADARIAFQWLEQQAPPAIVAPAAMPSVGYRLSVPNNAMDIVARAWCRGNESNSGDASPATHRAMKPVRSMRWLNGDAIHYLWRLPEPLSDEVGVYLDTLAKAASAVVSLGWGIDLAAGYGTVMTGAQVAALQGERWLPGPEESGLGLRVPREGTLDALVERHGAFLARLGPAGFVPPPPLSAYAIAAYRKAGVPPSRSVAAFSLLNLDAGGFRAFDAARRGLTVAGMARHAFKRAAEKAGWPAAKINTFILGHGEMVGQGRHVPVGPRRFAYIPLPSLEARSRGMGDVVGAIRRILVLALSAECSGEIAWARRALSGVELVGEEGGQPVAFLSLLPAADTVVERYTRAATTWASVTPVVLPGFFDGVQRRWRHEEKTGPEETGRCVRNRDERIDGLLRKAIVHAGYDPLLARHAELEWRRVGYWPGTELARRYGVPDHLRYYPRLHVRLRWRDPEGRPVSLPGPLCIGSGRFFGVGLFAPLPLALARMASDD